MEFHIETLGNTVWCRNTAIFCLESEISGFQNLNVLNMFYAALPKSLLSRLWIVLTCSSLHSRRFCFPESESSQHGFQLNSRNPCFPEPGCSQHVSTLHSLGEVKAKLVLTVITLKLVETGCQSPEVLDEPMRSLL